MSIRLNKILLTVVLVYFFAPTISIGAERYYTWVDEQGRVHHTVIPEEKNPLIVDKQLEPNPDVIDNEPTTSESLIPNSEEKPAAAIVEPAAAIVTPAAAIVEPAASLPTVEQIPATKPVEINEDDYIDGDVLEQQGNIRDEGDLPYYTWTDEQGVLRTTPYRPVSDKPQSNTEKKKVKQKIVPIIYTVSEEYYKEDLSIKVEAEGQVDDFARALFFKGSNFISSFSALCCEDLPKASPYELDFSNSIYIEVNNKTESHVFSGGKSPFLLIQLPYHKSNYSLELKTFVKNNSRSGVKNAAFYPQLTFLDENFEVMRILRNPILEFTPENWYKHGYLKGLFELDASKEERYLLLTTSRKDVRAKNMIEGDKPFVIHHQKTGSFEIKASYVN